MTKRLIKSLASFYPYTKIMPSLHRRTKSIFFLSLFLLFFNRDRTIPIKRLRLLSITDWIATDVQLANERTDQLFLELTVTLKNIIQFSKLEVRLQVFSNTMFPDLVRF